MALYCEARRPAELAPEGLKRLALAILAQAMLDAASQNREKAIERESARAWLLQDGAFYARLAGIGHLVDGEDISAWIRKGCQNSRTLLGDVRRRRTVLE